MPVWALNPRLWVKAGVGLIIALLLAWGLRVDHLRAGYKQQLDTIRIAFSDIGEKVSGYDKLAVAVHKVDIDRQRYKRERDAAQGVVEVQSSSIRALEAETAEAVRQAEQKRKQIAEVTRQRDAWIARARQAETRTERMSAEKELEQCEQVLDRLYASGF